MKTNWEINTENSRQSTTIPDSELLQCESAEDAAAMIEDTIEADFAQMTWACYDSEEILEECRKLFKTRRTAKKRKQS